MSAAQNRADNLLPSLRAALLECADFDGRYYWRPAAMEKLFALGLTSRIVNGTSRGPRVGWGLTAVGREVVAILRKEPS